jgi:uncharacterized protein (DUF342 family)
MLPEQVTKELDQQATVPLESPRQTSTDGTVDIEVSKDEMLVHATFHPPVGDGNPIRFETVQEAVTEARITVGVDWGAVKGCVLTCNEERTGIREAVIACGSTSRSCPFSLS